MRNMITNNQVLLGLSGGVDSTAAALLLKEKGYKVTGLFLDVMGNRGSDVNAAESVAGQLCIDFLYKDVSQQFNEDVIQYFCRAYVEGITPNPCVQCNPLVKFNVLTKTADELGIHWIATGHYARIFNNSNEDPYFIYKARSFEKDQSYMLYRLNQDVLSRLLLPLGELNSKEEVRELVKERGISNAETKDSQEICFIKNHNYTDYIINKGYENKPGDFLNMDGKVIGRHKGIIHYTIGQRKNLGQTFGKPKYVVQINPRDNTVTLGDYGDLFRTTVYATEPFFTAFPHVSGVLPNKYKERALQAKIRYAAPAAEARVYQEVEKTLQIQFREPQRAVTPGQSIVFYDGEKLIGGAIIQA
ncbi:MAG: tRNA 2-thiouridine(34) synthase MnmA [Eubacteriales bacterium]|nr:tRNA 2-thiouridine(34) synthase MnmA [Eubacteriales bacterium]MDD4584157.1 tRNA 2-thiouridine(34) synthase MnmA [Eubacteriales bacterium]